MPEEYSNEKVVIAHVAENATEALVIRGLLESKGIQSPGSVSTDPFPIPEQPEGPHNVESSSSSPRPQKPRKSSPSISPPTTFPWKTPTTLPIPTDNIRAAS